MQIDEEGVRPGRALRRPGVIRSEQMAATSDEMGKATGEIAIAVSDIAQGAERTVEMLDAAKEISHLIGAIQAETTNAVGVVESGARRSQEGVEVVAQTREAFMKIGSSVEDMNARIDEIAAVSQQIAASAAAMEEDMDEITAVAVQASQSRSRPRPRTSASSQEIAASAQELSGNAELLNRLVGQFRLSARD